MTVCAAASQRPCAHSSRTARLPPPTPTPPACLLQDHPSRVVILSSYAHNFNGPQLPLDDLNWEDRKYGAWRAYGQSKLCNILCAKELARRRVCL